MAKKKTNKKQNKKINTIKKNIMQVILLSLIIFIIILFAYQIISLVINPTDSFIVKQGTISQAESLTGYVIRDEKVIETDENQTKLIQIKNCMNLRKEFSKIMISSHFIMKNIFLIKIK